MAARTGRTCVVLSNGVVGAEKQAIALARATGLDVTVRRVLPNRALARAPTGAQLVAARTLGLSVHAFSQASAHDVRALREAPFPALAVSCGRGSIMASAALRRASAGRTRTVHIQHPRCAPDAFDWLVLPSHDLLTARTRPRNALVTVGSVHEVSAELLERACARHAHSPITRAPGPRVALLLGGPTAAAPYSAADATALVLQAQRVAAAAGGSLLVSASRRTPAAVLDALRTLVRGTAPVAHVWDGLALSSTAALPARARGGAERAQLPAELASTNPYSAFLALADHVIVTCDSVNMCTEACASAHHTRARVHVALGDAAARRYGRSLAALVTSGGAHRRLLAFHQCLFEGGAAVAWSGELCGVGAQAAPSLRASERAGAVPPRATSGGAGSSAYAGEHASPRWASSAAPPLQRSIAMQTTEIGRELARALSEQPAAAPPL